MCFDWQEALPLCGWVHTRYVLAHVFSYENSYLWYLCTENNVVGFIYFKYQQRNIESEKCFAINAYGISFQNHMFFCFKENRLIENDLRCLIIKSIKYLI